VQYKINLDINSGNPIGIGLPPHTSWKGRRTTSTSAFIEGKHLDNLKIFTNSRVVKILVEGSRAIGVQLEKGEKREFSLYNDLRKVPY
jgi:choline dehydrogenase-like flavoprotein